MHQREDRRIGPNPQRHRKHNRNRKTRRLVELTQRNPDVPHEVPPCLINPHVHESAPSRTHERVSHLRWRRKESSTPGHFCFRILPIKKSVLLKGTASAVPKALSSQRGFSR